MIRISAVVPPDGLEEHRFTFVLAMQILADSSASRQAEPPLPIANALCGP